MWIRLLKSHILHTNKKLPVGRVLRVTREYGGELISKEVAEEYTGPIPPIEKLKTDFFQPK